MSDPVCETIMFGYSMQDSKNEIGSNWWVHFDQGTSCRAANLRGSAAELVTVTHNRSEME